ncbi:FAD-dependent oxidoreductase [Amycolatopsis jejuensis]|uniref:FAD-dependent oxidoreductase n=1 Tax=Amycolatopsis jejuensis TaxID=330084 RepID=UPI0005250E15|nr:NAD(P)/FAD-dependent oxidoreductase [Amycolatopsis jejuensis]
MKVIIAGAGLGGLTLAQGLRKAGIDVTVYERDGPHGRRQGISLHVDDRGRTALRACLPPGHAAMAEATMGGPREQAQVMSEVDGRLAVTGAGPRARPGRQAHRPLLREILLTGLDDVVHFDKELTQFENREGGVRVHFADGTTDYADVLVGADGVGSAVRRQRLPDVHVIDTGKRMLMGAAPLSAVESTGLPELIGHNATSVQVRGKTMALGLLRFTESPAAARERWLPACAMTDVEDYLMWAIPTTQDRLGEAAAGLPPVLQTVVDSAWPDTTVALRIGIIPPMPAWPPTPVTLLGDAIHLAPGFGGNLAMRDALHLRDALVRAERGEQELHTAIGDYEEALRRTSFPEMASA